MNVFPQAGLEPTPCRFQSIAEGREILECSDFLLMVTGEILASLHTVEFI